eukprot:3112572-Rhodomonas_salina.4
MGYRKLLHAVQVRAGHISCPPTTQNHVEITDPGRDLLSGGAHRRVCAAPTWTPGAIPSDWHWQAARASVSSSCLPVVVPVGSQARAQLTLLAASALTRPPSQTSPRLDPQDPEPLGSLPPPPSCLLLTAAVEARAGSLVHWQAGPARVLQVQVAVPVPRSEGHDLGWKLHAPSALPHHLDARPLD